MADQMQAQSAAIMSISSILLIFATIFVLVRSKTLEMRLILIGVFMAIAAAVQESSVGVHIGPGNMGGSLNLTAGSLMKVAAILILSGVALAALERTRPATAPAATEPKEVSHGA
jgi:hypothetical protein